MNKSLANSHAWSQDGGQCRKRSWGQDKGFIVRTACEAMDGREPLPQAKVLLQLQKQKLFSKAPGGVVIGTCFWKATWQQVVRDLNMFLPSISRNLS